MRFAFVRWSDIKSIIAALRFFDYAMIRAELKCVSVSI